jgi:SAM-dependent methyltransferase
MTAYDTIGIKYAGQRQTDPRIAERIWAALGDARTVLNVGAGTGSYEPEDRYVVAVEPSAVMRGQRSSIPAIIGTAGALPFDDNAFDASMAMLTVHHWPSAEEGLKEMRRVTKGPVVVFTYDPDALKDFWFFDYTPELLEIDSKRFPKIDLIAKTLGSASIVEPIAVAQDCLDGFLEAYYARPEALLNPSVRRSQSLWSLLPAGAEQRVVATLADEVASGVWDKKYGHYREMSNMVCGLRLITGQ